jgi:hypothetical protein
LKGEEGISGEREVVVGRAGSKVQSARREADEACLSLYSAALKTDRESGEMRGGDHRSEEGTSAVKHEAK